MCLAAFAIGLSARFPFVLLANRDESFDRAAAPMAWWSGQVAGGGLLAGRDLCAGGTWLGLTATGRLALVTNVREPGQVLMSVPSRGDLVPLWLRAGHAVHDTAALEALGSVARNGFNLVVADLAGSGPDPARWLSNRPVPRQRGLGLGVHGLSNAALDTPWPKLVRLKQCLSDMLAAADDLQGLQAAGFGALSDPRAAPDADLPATGLSLQRERQLSSAFIRIVGDDPARAVYGTRCATVIVMQRVGRQRSLHTVERSFGPAGEVAGEVRYDWAMPAA